MVIKRVFLILIVSYLSSCGTVSSVSIYNDSIAKVVEIRLTNTNSVISFATGTLISSNGYILTNRHVLQYKISGDLKIYETIEVRFASEEDFRPSSFVSISEDYDLGLIKSSANKSSFFKEIDDSFCPGKEVYSIGNANGFGLSFLSGTISSNLRYVTNGDNDILAIQTDLPISEGCSGGPLFSSENKLLGIMAFRLVDEDGDVIQGMSFAIPSVSIIDFIAHMNF